MSRNPSMPAHQLRADGPVDWAARFRAAADVVHEAGDYPVTEGRFDDLADRLESGLLPPHVVEAIGRALTEPTRAA